MHLADRFLVLVLIILALQFSLPASAQYGEIKVDLDIKQFPLETLNGIVSVVKPEGVKQVQPNLKVMALNASEISILKSEIQKARKLAPSIFKVFGKSNKLIFIRISSPSLPIAMSNGGTVLLNDSFFNKEKRTEIFVHELAHSFDNTGSIVFSNDWISYCLPKIRTVMLYASFLDSKEMDKFSKYLNEENIVPSIYSATSLTESFAECFSYFSQGWNSQGKKDFFALIQRNQLDKASKSDKIYREALEAFTSKEYNRAYELFSEFNQKHPGLPKVLCLLGWLAKNCGKKEESSAYYKQVIDFFEANKIDASERLKRFAIKYYCWHLEKEQNYSEARKYLEESLEFDPASDFVRQSRAYCNRNLADPATTLIDKVSDSRVAPTFRMPKYCSNDSSFSKKALEKILAKNSRAVSRQYTKFAILLNRLDPNSGLLNAEINRLEKENDSAVKELCLAELYLEQKSFLKALEAAQRADVQASHRESLEARLLVFKSYYLSGDLQNALQEKAFLTQEVKKYSAVKENLIKFLTFTELKDLTDNFAKLKEESAK